MKYVVEMGSGATIYVSSLTETSSAIQKLVLGDTDTHKEYGDRISLLSFLQNKESGQKTKSISWPRYPKSGGNVFL
jgi:hypothetical protein